MKPCHWPRRTRRGKGTASVFMLHTMYIHTERKPSPGFGIMRMGMVTSGCMDQCRTSMDWRRASVAHDWHWHSLYGSGRLPPFLRLVHWSKDGLQTKKQNVERYVCAWPTQKAGNESYDAIQIPIALTKTWSQHTVAARLPAHPDPRRLDFVGIREVPWLPGRLRGRDPIFLSLFCLRYQPSILGKSPNCGLEHKT